MRKTGIAVVAALLAAGVGAAPAAAAEPGTAAQHATSANSVHVTTKKTIRLPGVGGHGDVVSADPGTNSVYIAQSPDNNVVVLNTTTNTIRTVVHGVPDANGIAYNQHYLFVAEASTNRVAVISKRTWHVVATVWSGGKAPDGVYYDSRDNTVFVVNDGSNNMKELSAAAPFKTIGILNLKPSNPVNGPDLGTYVRQTNTLFQSVDNKVLRINAGTRTIERVFTLPIPRTESAKDIFYNSRQNLLWVATTDSRVIVISPSTGAVKAVVKTASGIDQVSGAQSLNLLFLGEGDAGVMGIIDMQAMKNIRNVHTEIGFHTLAYLPGTNDVYAYLNYHNKVNVYAVSRP